MNRQQVLELMAMLYEAHSCFIEVEKQDNLALHTKDYSVTFKVDSHKHRSLRNDMNNNEHRVVEHLKQLDAPTVKLKAPKLPWTSETKVTWAVDSNGDYTGSSVCGNCHALVPVVNVGLSIWRALTLGLRCTKSWAVDSKRRPPKVIHKPTEVKVEVRCGSQVTMEVEDNIKIRAVEV